MVNLSRKAIIMMAGILVVILTLSSCDTLKQKFVRKKKSGDEDQGFVPVLEPEDYPTPANNPELNYKENYQMIKAWYKDLWSSIEERDSGKYTHYIITQVDNHIDQMKPLVDAQTQKDLDKLAIYLDYYKSCLDESWQVRDINHIESDLRYFDRFMRDHLRADKIKGHFIVATPPPPKPEPHPVEAGSISSSS